jgi:hypothetical protein
MPYFTVIKAVNTTTPLRQSYVDKRRQEKAANSTINRACIVAVGFLSGA